MPFDVPDPLPAATTGTLLRYDPVAAAGLDGALAYRIMYLSRSLQGTPIAVTGLALVPPGPAAASGARRIVTLGHGTAGLADHCAPSLQADPVAALAERAVDPAGFVAAGYVVVASDYEGLGTPGRHPYLVGESEGRSVLDAARAVRQLPGAEAGHRLGIFGYSQGGHAALWAQQLAASWTPELELVGTVAGAPATELPLIYLALRSLSSVGLLLGLVAGYQAAYPEADPALVLNEKGLALLDQVDRFCDDMDLGLVNADLVRPDYDAAEPWVALMARNDPGQVATGTPVLIVHSAMDETVPAQLSSLLYDRLQSLGQPVERRVYVDGGGHAETAPRAAADALAWLATRPW